MASASPEHQVLRRLPMLQNLTDPELDEVHKQMVCRFYPAGKIIWRTRGPLQFNGYIQSGEVELEFRLNGSAVSTTRRGTGDLLPPRRLHNRIPHGTVIARAITDVRLKILPATYQIKPLAVVPEPRPIYWLWPVLLFTLVLALAWGDLARITAGLLYLSFAQVDNPTLQNNLLAIAQKVEPDAAFTYNEQGYRWFQQDQKANAATAFEAALDRDPDSALALNNLGITQFSQGDLSQAAHYLQQAVEQDPDNAITHYNRGILLMQTQDLVGAMREFRQAAFIDPGAPLPALQESYLYQQMGEYAKAEQRARAALALEPALAPAHMLLGSALYHQGREAEALVSFMQALALQPENRTAAFYRALILGHLQQYPAALSDLQALRSSSTDPAEAARLQVEIDALVRIQAEAATRR